MSISIIITESQKRTILSESFKNDFEAQIKKNNDFIKKIVKDSSEQTGLNLEFMLTWGAVIGGFMRPIHDFVQGIYPEMSDIELSLVLTGIIAIHFIDNKKTVGSILETIKEKGFYSIFKKISSKSNELKRVFIGFIQSLGITFHKVTNILNYAFIIPILPMLYEIATDGELNNKDIQEIVKRLGTFTVLTVSGIIVKELITKLLKRFNKTVSD
jgi:riboflavin transporter FmnP